MSYKGKIDYVTYPNNQGTEDYTYDDTPSGRGRLSNITYPDGRSLSFSWNSRDKLAQLTATQGATETITIFSYDSMNRISGYTKTITEIGMPPQSETWNFYFCPTGIDKATRVENGIQNLTIDYTTDMSERILSMRYDENVQGGYHGELFVTYDNYGNMVDLRDNSGNSAMAMLVDPNNALITQYNPADIDDPHSCRARDGFIGIEMWPGQDNRVYLQGHVVIPNDWGNVSTNGETTTTTDDTTDKDGGDDAKPCGNNFSPKDCDKIFTRGTFKIRNDFTPSRDNCDLANYCYDLAQNQIHEVVNKMIICNPLKDLLPKEDWEELSEGLKHEYETAVGRGKGLAKWLTDNKKECDKYRGKFV